MVRTKYAEGPPNPRGRKEALPRLIPLVDAHNSVRVQHIVKAWQNYRYKGQDPTQMVQNEPNKPAHDWSSHPTTAAEFFAVIAQIELLTGSEPPKPAAKRKKRDTRPMPPGYTSFAPLR